MQMTLFDCFGQGIVDLPKVATGGKGGFLPIKCLEEALFKGPCVQGAKDRIRDLFKKGLPTTEIAKEVKDIYGLCGAAWGTPDFKKDHENEVVCEGYSSLGSKFTVEWLDHGEEFSEDVTWKAVATTLEKMVVYGKY